jgi:hypothetical protein
VCRGAVRAAPLIPRADAGRDFSEAVEPSTTLRLARVHGEVTASHSYVLLKDRTLPAERRQRSFMLAAPVTGAAGTPAAGRFLGWMIVLMRGSDLIDETLDAYAGDLVKVTLSDVEPSSVNSATPTPLSPAAS